MNRRDDSENEGDETVSAAAQDIVEGTSAVLIGLGNIGGFAAGLFARLRGLECLTLVDRDTYDESNLFAQDITAADVGKPKAVVQAERLRRIIPALRVEAVVDDIEHVPLGLLRADVLVACLDSRRARQSVNQIAWRLGVPWVDAGVRAESLLARVNVYAPAAGQPCMECAWDRRDYELVEQVYPCNGDAPASAATNAPASLGALAAALQVLECQKLLAGETESAAVGRQILLDAASHRHFVTSYRRNPSCRFDHATWQIEMLDRQPHQLTVGDAFALAPPGRDADGPALRVEGQVFVMKLTCPACGDSLPLFWRLSGRLGDAQQCRRCQRRMRATGFEVAEWLREQHLPPRALGYPLCDLGFSAGDVVCVRNAGGERHVQLGQPLSRQNLDEPRKDAALRTAHQIAR